MNRAGAAEPGRDLVLVGGGHAHVQVIRRWMMAPLPDVRLSVVLDRPVAAYSGMVPGFVAGEFLEHELEIDVVPLARRAGARVVLSAATRIDAEARLVEFEGRPPLRYDVASLDIGSTVRGLTVPGVREYALATRPIGRFVAELSRRVEALPATPRIVVVGSGAAGVELAFTLEARLRAAGSKPQVVVVGESPSILPGAATRVSRAVAGEAQRRGIQCVVGARVDRVEPNAVVLDGRESPLPADLVVWAAGAAPTELATASDLPRDERGFIAIGDTLEVDGYSDLFAVGDCAGLLDHAWVPKAGVYAVRQGPVLDANLRARLTQRPLRRYRPQRGFLALLNLGEGRALGSKWGLALAGTWVWQLKAFIDRRFMRKFQVLSPDGTPAPGFPTPEAMGMEPMDCGGCAAKLGPASLEAALARLPEAAAGPGVQLGMARPDDAAAVSLPGGDVLVASIDGFRAFCDDPWIVGRVAAVNAVSDVYAKGGRPLHALALVTLPEGDSRRAEDALYQVLSGVRAALDPLGVTLLGGHTTRGPELFVGLSITGDLPPAAELMPLDAARAGDRLVLTQPLGSGVLLAADMQGLARGPWVEALHGSLMATNDRAADIAGRHGVLAATDVSGFGLAGHLDEMLAASGVSCRLRAAALPQHAGALALLSSGVRSTFHAQNAERRSRVAVAPGIEAMLAELLFDPQTSGGLLMAVAASRVESLVASLHAAGDGAASEIGSVVEPRSDGVRIVLE